MSLTLASGILAQLTPAASSLAVLYTAPANVTTAVSVVACNRNGIQAKIRIAVTISGTTTYLEYDEPLAPAGQQGGSYCLRAIPIQAGGIVKVYADQTNVDFTAMGYDDPQSFIALEA